MENVSMSMYSDKLQIWGLGSDFDTQAMVDAELMMLELRNQPLIANKANLQTEKDYWKSFENQMKKLNSLATTLKDMDLSNQKVSFSNEGFVNVTASPSSQSGSYAIEVSNLASTHRFMSDEILDSGSLGLQGSTKINGVDFEIDSSMTKSDIVNAINQGSYGVDASIINNRIVFTSQEEGVAGLVSLTDAISGASGIFEQLGFLNTDGSIKSETQAAIDANFKINGVEVTSSSNKISDVVPGMDIELIKKTTSPIDFNVKGDSEALLEKVREFVSSYNQTINQINAYGGKEGVLQGERVLSQAKRAMNEALTIKGDGDMYLFKMGITLDADAKNGTIKFDESAFRKALEEAPESVFGMLTKEQNFGEVFQSKINSFVKASGSISSEMAGLDSRMNSIDKTIDRNKVQMEREKEGILEKFARYEMSMSSLGYLEDYMKLQLEGMNWNKK